MLVRLQAVAILLAIGATGCSGGATDVAGQAPVEGDLAFVDVVVITMASESMLMDQTVVVRDGAIVNMGPSPEVAVADTATIVAAQGKYLIPGLADMHVHVNDEDFLTLFVAHGVTLVRNMWGFPEHLRIREGIASGRMLGPRIVTSGAIVDGLPPIWDSSVSVTNAAAAVAEMDAQREAGFDFLKIYEQLPAEAFSAIAERSRETGFAFAGHVPQSVPIETAMRAGMLSIEHLTGWDDATALPGSEFAEAVATEDRQAQNAALMRIAESLVAGEIETDDLYDPQARRGLAELAAETGVWHVPTLIVNERVRTSRRQAEMRLAEPAMRFIGPALLQSWDPNNDFRREDFSDDELEASQAYVREGLERVRALRDAGARLLAGSDTPNPWVVPGVSLHQELAWLVAAGLSPYEALEAATRAPAEFLGDDSFGTIAVGQRAELVLLNANPLEDIHATADIAGVATQGRWLSRATLDAMLDGVAEAAYAGVPE